MLCGVRETVTKTMTYAFLIVVSVAITLKLLFLSFSLYFTMKASKAKEVQVRSKPNRIGCFAIAIASLDTEAVTKELLRSVNEHFINFIVILDGEERVFKLL